MYTTLIRLTCGASVLAAAGLMMPGAAVAQASARMDSARAVQASRTQLEAQASQLQRTIPQTSDAGARADMQARLSTIQHRLSDGDFMPGDRIAIVIRSDSAVNDTAVVRAGQVLQLKNLPDIPLHGVLHSELHDYLTKELGKYYRDPQIQTTSLMQIAVLGSVAKPGFYAVPTDMTLSDAIMLAGGPAQTGNLSNTEMRRDNTRIYDKKQMQKAFASGATVDEMGMRSGDAIVIGEKVPSDWLRVVQIGALAAGVALGVYGVTRH